ncbi:trithorax group protein osa [Austrofundulus limnaeus]|uniref:Trithorax group protein osa n=1 Tax=Austrofundulus limnaeus TaxID=52670 RepID=A0A2I4C5A2_AUSLI|nr:PREDICTED: trithorax group protein osa-like [Austrofundulus limnaeus]
MMAVLASSGVWFLVMLTGTSNGYSTMKALDPYSGYDVDFSGSAGGVPPSGLTEASPGSSSTYPVNQPAPYEQPEYIQPNAQMRQAPDHHNYMHTAPVYSQYDGGSTQLKPQVPPFQDNWAVQPPSPFLHRAPFPDDPRFASNPEPPGPHMSPPGSFYPVLQPGDLTYEERTYEHGDHDSESEEKIPPQYLPMAVPALNTLPIGSPLALHALLNRFRLGYPFVDYNLVSRRRRPGKYTLSTDNFEHGQNLRHDFLGTLDGTSTYSDPFRDPRSSKYFRRPVRHRVGRTGYGIDGAMALPGPTVELV